MSEIRNLFILLASLALCQVMQGQAFKKADFIVNINYGAPNAAVARLENLHFNPERYTGFFPDPTFLISSNGVYSIRGEYALNNKLSVGLSCAYWSMDVTETFRYGEHRQASLWNVHDYKYNYHLSSLSLAVRGNYHFLVKNKVDAFLGVGLGITNHVSKYQYYPDSPNTPEVGRKTFKSGIGPHASLSIGLRYYFFPFLGLNIEAGYDTGALFLGGLVYKISTKQE